MSFVKADGSGPGWRVGLIGVGVADNGHPYPYREVRDPEGPQRRVRSGDAGSGDAGLQGDVAGWWCAVGPVPPPGGQRLGNTVMGGFKERLRIRRGWKPGQRGGAAL